MSFVTAVRDYVDLVNSSYESVPVNAQLLSWVIPILAGVLGSLKHAMLYLLSFQWLRDLLYLPLLVPQLSLSILRESCYPLENPLLNLFTFLEEPIYRDNKLLVGILNSFFACLPLSAAHILSGRRLLVQGVPAGVAAGGGIVAAQCWFVACVILGLRPLLIPWLAWEPFNWLLGIGLLVNTVYRITHERRIRVTKWADRGELTKYFLLSFVLTLCEQTTIFQYLGNLNVGAEPTSLDTFSSSSGGGSLLTDGAYVGGFTIGSLLFAFLLGWLGLRLKGVWSEWWSTTSRVTNWLNTFFLITLVAFSFASVPYYGVDYLVTSRLGFLPNDTALDGTILAPTTIPDINKVLGRLSDALSFDTDVATFDRGDYVLDDDAIPQSFEDLNYQGEYAWTRRTDKEIRHVTTRRAHPFWHKLLSSVPLTNPPEQPQPGDQSREQAKNRPSGPNLAGRIGKPSAYNAEVDAIGGGSESVSDLLDRRTNVASELFEAASPDEDGERGASSPSGELEADKLFERQFTDEFPSGLSMIFNVDTLPEPDVAKTIKGRYMANPLYSLLLRADIDTFLGRQPSSYLLSPREESLLFQRRQVVSQYCDALRQYNQLQHWDEFGALHQGSKSFASRVYNQQFKGTLKVVRRLFSIALDEQEGPGSKRVLKLDQPLFEQRPTQAGGGANLHEELAQLSENEMSASPFLENANPRPLYAGWDEDLRKLVLTNRSLPRSQALHRAGEPINASEGNQYGRFNALLSRDIVFTAWPIQRDTLLVPKSQSSIPYQVAFESDQDPKQKDLGDSLKIFGENADAFEEAWEMSSWPPNLRLKDQVAGIIPTRRGGFVWPGHAQLRLGQEPTKGEAK
jgi:hypothetical protein